MTKDRKDLFQEALKLCDIELMGLSGMYFHIVFII